MRVLMRIEMSGLNARGNNLLALKPKFAAYIQASLCQLDEKVYRLFGKRPPSRQRDPLHQNQVAADVKRGRLARQPYRIVKCVTIRHQRRGSEHTFKVRLHNSCVHVVREPEIVRIDGQFPQLENMEFNAQELLGIGAEILQRPTQFAEHTGRFIIERRVDQQLPKGALAGIQLVDCYIDLFERRR